MSASPSIEVFFDALHEVCISFHKSSAHLWPECFKGPFIGFIVIAKIRIFFPCYTFSPIILHKEGIKHSDYILQLTSILGLAYFWEEKKQIQKLNTHTETNASNPYILTLCLFQSFIIQRGLQTHSPFYFLLAVIFINLVWVCPSISTCTLHMWACILFR